jgi:hypothetical protein
LWNYVIFSFWGFDFSSEFFIGEGRRIKQKNYFKVVKKYLVVRETLENGYVRDALSQVCVCVICCVYARMMCAAPARPRPPLRVTRERHPEHLTIKKLNVWPDNEKIEAAIFLY